MAWRGLHISRPAKLRLKNRRLEIDQESGVLQFALEDVAWVILDTPQVTASAAVLAACMEENVPLIISDARHTPCGVLMPFHQHYRQAEIGHVQVAIGAPLRKRLWQLIVRQKLVNQAGNLERGQIDGHTVLKEMTRHVQTGDPGNVEARGARYYWPRLFLDFVRQDETDRRNALLNYGYAVLRAAIARSCVAAGLIPAFGLHHQSVQNAFNLADDLLEPDRPLTDWKAFELSRLSEGDKSEPISLEDRQAMVTVLSETVVIAGEQMPVLAAIDRTVASLIRAFCSGSAKPLQLPNTW